MCTGNQAVHPEHKSVVPSKSLIPDSEFIHKAADNFFKRIIKRRGKIAHIGRTRSSCTMTWHCVGFIDGVEENRLGPQEII